MSLKMPSIPRPELAARPAPAVDANGSTESLPKLHVETPVDVRNVALTLVGIGAAIAILQFMQSILIPFVLGALLFYALDPAVDRLQQIRVPRAVGAALVLLLVVAGTGSLIYSLRDEAMTVINELPAGARRLARTIQRRPADGPSPIEKVQQAADELQKPVQAPDTAPGVLRVQVEEEPFRASTYLWSGSLGLLPAFNQVVMVLFLTYFMLLSDELFRRKLVEIVGPTLARKKVTVQILEEIAAQIERFLLIQILTSAIVAVATWLTLWWLGLEQAGLWGLVAGVFNSIPYYGPLLVTGVLAVVAFLQFGNLGMTAAVAGAALLITTLEGSLLTPRLMGKVAQMNTVAVFAGLLFWSWAWGVWGLLLAVPMMMVIKSVCDRVERLQPIGHLLGE